ncbi:MAG: hypothetical protein FJX74_21290, partial [Armatimonadetes bacterium]|nr:hypothetical protein [Armatimonadota bacterium]
MSDLLTVTTGPESADFTGRDHLALQAAVDYVTALGGGTVRILAGTYEMGNSLFLRSGLRLVGAGEDTILRKCPSVATRLTDDTDWYDTTVTVEDGSLFRVGGGILLRGKCPHYAKQQFVKRTVVAVEGNVLHLDRDPRENFWIDMEAEAARLFPVVTGDNVNDLTIESLTIDGNRAENENLNGNYGGGLFLQDCDRVTVRDVTTRDNNGDGISWQVCDDVTIDSCRSLNNADLGLHPGSGSQRPVVTNCVIRGCDQGFFFCWGVRYGRVESNLIENSGKYGISIGHRDTDNLVRGNTIRRSGALGILFREHPVPLRDPHRNLFEDNLIEDSG